jgi:hypothetical protein
MNRKLSEQVLQGLATCSWAGRNQIITTNNATFYIDGAQYISIDMHVTICSTCQSIVFVVQQNPLNNVEIGSIIP